VVKIQEEVTIKSQMLNKENLLSERDQMLEQYELKQYMEGVEQQKKTLIRLADKFPVLQGHYLLIIIGSPNIRLNASDINPVARIKAIAVQTCGKKLNICIEYNNYILMVAEAGTDADTIIQSINENRIKTVSAICGFFKGISELPGACSQVMELYNHRFLFPEKSILTISDTKNLKENYTIPYHDIDHIMHIIGNCSNMEIDDYINRVFHRDTLVKYKIGYTLAICDHVYRNLKVIEKVIRPYIEDAMIDVNKNHSLMDYESMREYLKVLRFQMEKMNDLFCEFKISYRDNNDMNKAIAYINMNYERPLTLAMVSNTVSLNYTYFSNVFKKYTGQSFLEYLRNIRVGKAKKLLSETDFRIAEISDKVGYDSYKNFSRAFKEETGITPIEYRKTIQMVQN
jgi:two-component system response regulator YesN